MLRTVLHRSQPAAIGLIVAITLVSCGGTSEDVVDAPMVDTAEQTVETPIADVGSASSVETDEVPEEVESEEPALEAGFVLSDIDQVPSPNKEMILELAQLGVFDEMGDDFNLLEPITRGQFLELLYYANNAVRESERHIRLAPVFDPGFSDISDGHPSYRYVQAFASTGYSVGYADGTFKPDQPLTREEMVGIKVPVDTVEFKEGPRIDGFNDVDQISEEFFQYVYHDQYVNGEKGGNIDRAFGSIVTLRPDQPVLGYEAAAAVWEFPRWDGFLRQETAADAIEALEQEE